ncbi:DUF454 family protein [Thermocrinis sp.]
MKWIYRFFAWSFMILAFIGLFVPLLPTVPFLLLAIFFMVRSSKKDLVRIKKLPFLGRKIYPYIKRWARWNTRPQSSSI